MLKLSYCDEEGVEVLKEGSESRSTLGFLVGGGTSPDETSRHRPPIEGNGRPYTSKGGQIGIT